VGYRALAAIAATSVAVHVLTLSLIFVFGRTGGRDLDGFNLEPF
jgi:hypothetical protein